MKIFKKKDNIHIFLILLWIIFWIYLYNNPIHFLWQPIVLFSIPIYLFLLAWKEKFIYNVNNIINNTSEIIPIINNYVL